MEIAFKDRFKQARLDKNLSQGKLAKLINVNVMNISRYERGENLPSSEMLHKLADALRVSADYLMNGSTDEIAQNAISDKELLSQFKKVEMLSDNKKRLVKEFLDAFLFKDTVQKQLS